MSVSKVEKLEMTLLARGNEKNWKQVQGESSLKGFQEILPQIIQSQNKTSKPVIFISYFLQRGFPTFSFATCVEKPP